MEGSVLSLPQAIVRRLVQHLEPVSALGKDWKGLAGVIGFTARHTTYIEARGGYTSKTATLLKSWAQSGRSSVRKLVLALLCLGREDCIRILQSFLTDVDLPELRARAAGIKDNYAEIAKVFPPFGDDHIICSDVWPSTPSSSTRSTSEPLGRENVSPVPAVPEDAPSLPLTPTVSLQQDSGPSRDRDILVARPARSPEEEAPSISANPSEATDVVPSKQKVFVSYYPESGTRHSMADIVGDLQRIGMSVQYANDREMMDPEYKTMAFASCYNILVFLTPRYYDEYQKLDASPSQQSFIKIDRTMIRDIFFSEQKRLILVSLDEYMHRRCVPSLYQALRVYHYPSQLTDLRHCVTDIPKFVAPPPTPKISVEPIRISFHAEVEAFQARQSAPLPLRLQPRSQRRRVQPVRTAPIPPKKPSIFGRMFKK